MRMQRVVLLAALAALCATGDPAVSARGGQQKQPQVPVFRSAITLVPVDVRVIDRSGKPVTDLNQEDFTILEDGVKQEIRHFSLQSFVPATPAPGAKLALREDAVSFEPQTNRIFLLVLGRGKLQEPSKTVDALLRFVRERILPQDQLAVFAYNRASTFTTDHEQIARVLDRFKKEHEQIDYEIGLQMSGLAAIYGSKLIPKSLQGKIDKMFEGSGLLASQRVEAGAAADKRIEADAARQSDAQIQQLSEAAAIKMMAGQPTYAQAQAMQGATDAEAAAAARGAAVAAGYRTSWSEIDEIQTQMFADLSLEDFVSSTAQTLQDLGNIYAGINYLKNFEGEKHLVFFTEKGLTLTRLEEDEVLAATANDARVAIDTIETGGIYVGQPGNAAGLMPDGRWNQTFAFKTLRTIADLTGGVSSIAEPGMTAIDRLNDVTKASYLLGYYPTNPKWDGAYRKVTLKVSRPGAQVFYRHGYYGRKELLAFSRREFITNDRIQAAGGFRREINDIRVKVNASLERSADRSGYELNVDASIDPSNLAFTFVEGVHVGQVSIAVFCFAENGGFLGNSMQTADLQLKDDVFKKVVASGGIPYKANFPMNPAVKRVRVVVYDFKVDLVGSADRTLR